MLQRYQGICVASRHMRKEYLRHGMTSESVHVTPLPPAGVSPDVSLAPAGVPSGVVLLVGRATELKAGPYLVDALSRAGARLRRALSLEIVGEGPALPALIARARRLGVPVSARPWAEPSQRNDRMRAAEVLLVPSTWPEPWGLVGLEAACVGLPSVAYAVGGIPEWLLAGESGELAPGDPPTAEGLAAALVRALGDRRHYERLRRGAWENSRRFTMERHLADLIPVLEGAARAGR
jgi:glycosyltransferase involved in cell wall biosynthesis